MIKSVEIKNFRNLANFTLDFTDTTSIISGKNELGKSNALNAICWMLTGTILTDKWGSGENDIDSIIPNNATRGINPEVSIILDNETKFTKKYVSKYSKDGEKVTGHTTEFYINNVICKNETEFTTPLYNILNYIPKLKTKDVNELRLFTDPLYALQKLDAKPLRALLVDLGCSVSNEELYALGFENLRQYENKYLGKWDVMRKALKDQNKVITKSIENIQAKIETVSNVKEYDSKVLDNLNKNLEDLIFKKANITNGNINPEIAEVEKQIAVLRNTIKLKLESEQEEKSKKIYSLKLEKQLLEDKQKANLNDELKPYMDEIGKLGLKIDELNTAIRAYDMAIDSNQRLITSYIDLGTKNRNEKTNFSIKLDAARNNNFDDFITCPICGSQFATDPDAQAQFEEHKQTEISNLIKTIQDCEKKNQEYKSKYDECLKLKNDAIAAKAKANKDLEDAKSRINELEILTNEIKSRPVDNSKINELDAQIETINNPVDLSNEYKELDELNLKLTELKNNDALKIQDRLNEIDIEIGNVKESISNEHIKKSKYNEKLEYQEALKNNQAELNDNEYLLATVNDFIQKMISMINERATEKTGLKFVMLEENLSNDGIKEVCYATIDDIPFKDVNTAKKLKYGIKFIEKLKELLGHNQLPILADRMEGIDSLESIKNLTKEQLICTRVSNGDVITIE